jgi:hypothetical protein
VLLLSGGNNYGGYGVVCKVRIKKFDRIPNIIELARKTPKLDDKQKTHKQRLVEALACPCTHPSVIKFLAPHKDHGGIYIMVEWGSSSKNVGLQHEIFPHY